jgi:hypothetical protein
LWSSCTRSLPIPRSRLDACLAATADYGLLLVADAAPGAPFCGRLARYLPGEAAPDDKALPRWDDATSLHCAAARDRVRVEVLTTPVETDTDPYAVCETLLKDGWELRPLDEGFPETPFSEAFRGECYVATARFERALVGESSRGQPFCDELADRYLSEPIRFRTPPVPDDPPGLGSVVCEARRRMESVRVARITEGRGAELERVCDALAEDGWTVTSWEIVPLEEWSARPCGRFRRWSRRDSNPWPSGCQPDALPAELRPLEHAQV